MPRKKVEKEIEPEVIEEPVSQMTESVQQVKKYPLFYLCCLLFVLLIVMTGLYVTKGSHQTVVVPTDVPSLNSEEQTETANEIVEAVAAIMLLPDDSEPLVATVNDAASLRAEQSFYNKVEDGDVLLVFQTSRQAVIYRPTANKIVNAGPLIVDQNVQ